MSVYCFQNSVLSGAQWDRNHSAESVAGLPMARTLRQSHQVPSGSPQPPPLIQIISSHQLSVFCDADTVLLLRISDECGARGVFCEFGATEPLSCLVSTLSAIENVGIGSGRVFTKCISGFGE